jgi:hypothetical protein
MSTPDNIDILASIKMIRAQISVLEKAVKTLLSNNNAKKQLHTEDTGKVFEMAICMSYQTPYVSKKQYKYGIERPTALLDRLAQLPHLFPACTHTAEKGSLYDFTSTDSTRHLSAKSTKKDCKVAPQRVGQATPATFCERMNIPFSSVPALKTYIQDNITSLLPTLLTYTFGPNTDVLFYNEKADTIQFITHIAPICWDTYPISWTCSATEWNNSSTMKMTMPDGKTVSMLEIQFHSSSRTNMAVRWCFDKLLTTFPSAFRIVNL